MEYIEEPEAQLSEEDNCAKEEEEDDGERMRAEKENEIKEEEKKEPQPPWAVLPDVCLRLVFWWLCDQDRTQAALVCRSWHQVIRSPSLWRQRTFSFSGQISCMRRSEREKATSYARTYGVYLEDLEVRFSRPINAMQTRRLQQTMQTFLSTLRRSGGCLRLLTIHHMQLDRIAWHHTVRSALVHNLTFHLRREGSHLSYLSLRGARINLSQGLEVLEGVVAAQQRAHPARCHGLHTLNLEDFFSQSLAVYRSPEFTRVMSGFRGLFSLTLNYSCVSDELLEALAVACTGVSGGRGSLRFLTVHCHILEPHTQVVRGDAWACLARRCPDIWVQILVEQILDLDRLSRILLREIPLRNLTLTSCYFSGQNWSLKPALTNILPLYRNCLQNLTLDMNNSHESVDEELLEVVLMCKRLIYLRVWGFLGISFLHRLLQIRLDEKCILKTIEVRLFTNKNNTEEEDAMLEEILSRYSQLIDSELNYFAVSCYSQTD